MWEGLSKLLGLCLAIAIASFVAGYLPIALSLSQKRLRYISTLGTGILVGSSLVVIIPEGIKTLYSSTTSLIKTKGVDDDYNHVGYVVSIHSLIGPALLSGFLLMYLIDRFPHKPTSTSTSLSTSLNTTAFSNASFPRPSTLPVSHASHISLANLSNDGSLSNSPIHNNPSFVQGKRHISTTTIGLVIHSAADGIALGASSTLANSHLNLVIFLAIMMHKAPAAFGLTAVLLRQGYNRRTVRTHLIAFTSAAPIGAIFVWALINILGRHGFVSNDRIQDVGIDGVKATTGLILLFSGGTFLYVATQIIKEPLPASMSVTDGEYESDNRLSQPKASSATFIETSAALFGMLVPLFLQMGHHH